MSIFIRKLLNVLVTKYGCPYQEEVDIRNHRDLVLNPDEASSEKGEWGLTVTLIANGP